MRIIVRVSADIIKINNDDENFDHHVITYRNRSI